MTITSEDPRYAGPFLGDGVVVAFPFDFKVVVASGVRVVLTTIATELQEVQALTTDYTVVLNADQNANPGGTVTMVVPPPTGTRLEIWGDTAFTQLVNLLNRGGFNAQTVTEAFDLALMRLIELRDQSTAFAASGVTFFTQTFSGNGVQTAFTLSQQPSSVNAVEVFITKDRERPIAAYTVSGTTLTFTTPPPVGTDNIFVRWAQIAEIGDLNITGLNGYDPNRYVDHTLVSILAGAGLTGGGTIAATRTLAINITGLDELLENDIDFLADEVMVWDLSGLVPKKVKVASLSGSPLGDGKWKLSTAQALSGGVEATANFNSAIYDLLERGTFDTATFTYTAAQPARIEVYAHASFTDLNSGHSCYIAVQKNNVSIAEDYKFNTADASALRHDVGCLVNISMATGDTMRVRLQSSNAESVAADERLTYLTITELA